MFFEDSSTTTRNIRRGKNLQLVCKQSKTTIGNGKALARMNRTGANLTHSSGLTAAEDIATKTLFVVVAIVNFAGNSMLIYVIAKHKRVHNTVNLLFLNLSIADIVTGVAVLPYLFVNGRSDILCGLKEGLPFFHAASMANFLTLVVLSLSRYLLINHATRPTWRVRKQAVKWFALASWLAGISIMMPNVVYSKYNETTQICEDLWLRGIASTATYITTLVISMVALLSMLFTYFATAYTLWFKASTQRLSRSNSVSNLHSSRKRVTVLLGMLIIAFLLCWIPFTVYFLLSAALHYFPDTVDGYAERTRVKRFTLLAAFLNTCMDPFFFAYGNSEIREEARKTFSKSKNNNTDRAAIELE